MNRRNAFTSDENIPAFSQKTFLLLLSILIATTIYNSSCSKENADVPEQITALIQTLKTENPNCTCQPYLNQLFWRNETVYMLGYKGPECSWRPTFYHANGQEFTLEDGYTYVDFDAESTLVKTVWTCE